MGPDDDPETPRRYAVGWDEASGWYGGALVTVVAQDGVATVSGARAIGFMEHTLGLAALEEG